MVSVVLDLQKEKSRTKWLHWEILIKHRNNTDSSELVKGSEEEGTPHNLFFEANIILIPQPDQVSTTKDCKDCKKEARGQNAS